MKISFLTIGGAALVFSLILGYLLVKLLTITFRKKYHPDSPLNVAQGITLAGKISACMILISGILTPIRDFLFISSSTHGVHSGAFWGFLAVCCCIVLITYVITSAFSTFLSKQVFKGKSLVVELQENNLAVGIINGVLILMLALALLSIMGIFMQAFIPVPSIPTIG